VIRSWSIFRTLPLAAELVTIAVAAVVIANTAVLPRIVVGAIIFGAAMIYLRMLLSLNP
jgi:hypothetical protein